MLPSFNVSQVEISKFGGQIKIYFASWMAFAIFVPISMIWDRSHNMVVAMVLSTTAFVVYTLFSRWLASKGIGFGMGVNDDTKNLIIKCKVTKLSWVLLFIAFISPIPIFRLYQSDELIPGISLLVSLALFVIGVVSLKTSVSKITERGGDTVLS